jgi:hypothetical protein
MREISETYSSKNGKSFFSEIQLGLMAPFYAIKFFKHHKMLLALVIVIYLAGFTAFMWAISRFFIPWGTGEIGNLFSLGTTFVESVGAKVFAVSIYIFATLIYGLVGFPVLNLVASPVFDIIAIKSFEHTSGFVIGNTGFGDFFKSFVMEILKLLFLALLLTASFVSIYVAIAAPIVFLFSLWFYGWQEVDRVLGMMRFGARERVWFGVKHAAGCACLGLWFYVPFFGTIFASIMPAAAGILVAKMQSEADIQRFLDRGGKYQTDAAKFPVLDERR